MIDRDPKFFAVVNDLIGGYDVSEWDKPVSQHDTRREGGEYTIGSFISQEWAERIANALTLVADPDTLIISKVDGFPSEYEWHLLKRWLATLLNTDRDYEARLVLALFGPAFDALLEGQPE